MIVVLDSDILFSALITPSGTSGRIYDAWMNKTFEVVTCPAQLGEIRVASRRPKLAHILMPRQVGKMMNHLRAHAMPEDPPRRHETPDPTDAFLLDLALACSAHYLVTGDKRSGLLQMQRNAGTRILTPAEFCALVLGLPS